MIPPFWQKTALFFKIPFSVTAISVIFAMLVLGNLASKIPIIGTLLVFIVIPTLFLKYAYLTLENVSNGNLTAPTFKDIFQDNDYAIVFKQIFILILLFIPTAKLSEISPALGIAWYFLILFLIPATVMVLSVEQRFTQAVNPILLLSFVQKIGVPYLGLYVFLLIVSGGPTIIMELILPPENSYTDLSTLYRTLNYA
ncbi:MAG: hypothetical protein HN790_04215, partial [Methylococcales bacterium]|nr:hypothetical protein [Methylococcales bacterium]